MVKKINRLARYFLTTGDRKIDGNEAKKLIESAKDGVSVTKAERRALERLIEKYSDKFTEEGKKVFYEFLGIEEGQLTTTHIEKSKVVAFYETVEVPEGALEPDIMEKVVDKEKIDEISYTNLKPLENYRQVFLNSNGFFVTSPDIEEPSTINEFGEGIYRVASIIDDYKGNIFKNEAITLENKQKIFNHIVENLGKLDNSEFNDVQKAQFRSSSATVLRDLMLSLKNEGPELELKKQIFNKYVDMIKKEPEPILRESMIFQLNLGKANLTGEMKGVVNDLMKEIAPLYPPYEEWFKDGNNTVNIDLVVGFGFRGHNEILKKNGFEQDPLNPNIFKKTIRNSKGVETTFVIRKRTIHRDMFAKMDDPNVHMVVYDGHSNWGRNVRSSLEASRAEGTGKNKVALIGLCAGKGELNMIRDKFPDAQVITTYNSSYFGPSEENMQWSENMSTLMQVIDGIAERQPWSVIARKVRDKVIRPHFYWHAVDNNYIFPTDVMIRRKILDRDHDGQADIFDKLVDFDTFNVQSATREEFEPTEPTHPVDKMVGIKPHMAVQTINRLSLYNELLEPLNNTGKVISGGWYEPQENDYNIVRFEKTKINGKTAYVMKANARYSKMSEESLRAVAMYEFTRYMAETQRNWKLDDLDTKLMGLILASHSLHTDSSYRDYEVWNQFLKAYNFPDIDRSLVEWAKEEGEGRGHFYSGSVESVRLLKEKLSPEILEKLKNKDVGVINP